MKARYRYILGRKKSAPEVLELEVYVSRDLRVYLSTQLSIPARFWDASRQQVSGRYPNAIEINSLLTKRRNELEKAELQAMSSGQAFTKDMIKQSWRHETISNIMLAEQFIRYHNSEYEAGIIRLSTYRNGYCVLQSMLKYLTERYGGDIPISQLDYTFVQEYELYISKKYKERSINTIIGILKKYSEKAVRDKYIPVNFFNECKIRHISEADKRQSLSQLNLSAVEELANSNELDETTQICIDKFLFSCYTGLRISDNNSLLKKEVLEYEYEPGKNGLLVRKKTIKTGILVKIPTWSIFGGKAQDILYKYLALYPTIPNIFPYVRDVNEYLKQIQKVLGITQHLTFHVARHTCATMLAEKTGNPFIIKSILGHANITMSMNYIHDNPSELISSIEKVDW